MHTTNIVLLQIIYIYKTQVCLPAVHRVYLFICTHWIDSFSFGARKVKLGIRGLSKDNSSKGQLLLRIIPPYFFRLPPFLTFFIFKRLFNFFWDNSSIGKLLHWKSGKLYWIILGNGRLHSKIPLNIFFQLSDLKISQVMVIFLDNSSKG